MDDHDSNHGNGPDSPCFKNNSNSNNNGSNKEQDRFLPIANVGRIMKKVIPGNGKISKDAKETVQECVSEFISFVTGEASDKCQREKRKTINGDDIIWAITTLGFEDYINPLKMFLNKYREIEGEKLNVPKQQRSTVDQSKQQQQNYHDHQLQCDHQCHQGFPGALSYPTNVYSSTTTTSPTGALIPQPPFVAPDPTFSLPFFPPPIQKNYQQHPEHIDSVGNW